MSCGLYCFVGVSTLESLTDEKTHGDHLDEEDEDRGHLMMRAIDEWDAQGFPGTWDELWIRFYTKHVEEDKERLIWSRADTHLNFRDWQNRRKAIEHRLKIGWILVG